MNKVAPHWLIDVDAFKVWEPAPEDALIDAYCSRRAAESEILPLTFAALVMQEGRSPSAMLFKSEIEKCIVHARRAMADQNMDALDGWLAALDGWWMANDMSLLELENDWELKKMRPKYRAKLRSEKALTPEVRAAGTQAGKAKAAARRAELHKAIKDYLNYPAALAKGNKACLRFLVERNLLYGYAEATVLDPHIKKLFAEKRKAMKAEN